MTREHPLTEERAYGLNPALIPSANPSDGVIDLLSMLANRVHAITGETNWTADPDATIAGLKSSLDGLNSGLGGHVGSTNGHPAATGSAQGFMTAAQFTKLAGIETGATADMTAAEIFAALSAYRGAASGLATLDSSGQVPEGQIPAVAITDTFEVPSQAAMLALTAQRGDVAIRSDINKSFVLRATPASTLSNWAELRTPTDAVLSAFGRTGAVSAQAGDYSADKITNTPSGSIAASTVQSALNELDTEKLPTSHLTDSDPHSQYQRESERNSVNGYAGLNASGFVDPQQLGSGTRDATTVLFGDGAFRIAPSGGGSGGSMSDADILAAVKRVDGVGSGIDSDLLDGLTSADFLLATARAAANGVAPLGADSLIPEAHIPAVAITDTFEVSTQTAMLALTAQRGDVAIRSDLNKSFILRATPASTLSNWSELRTPTDAVLSVFGRTGAVGATAGDYNASQITNTPAGDIASVTVQAALNELDSEKQTRTHGRGSTAPSSPVAGQLWLDTSTTPPTLKEYTGSAWTSPRGPAASESSPGDAEVATQAEILAGTDDSRFVTPLKLRTEIDRKTAVTKVERAANQNISNATWTMINWDNELIDTSGWWTSSSSGRITVTEAGVYQFTVLGGWAGSTTGVRFCRVLKNGSTSSIQAHMAMSAGVDNKGRFDTFGVAALAAGDYLSVEVNQTSGGALTYGDTSDINVPTPYFTLVRIA